MYEHFLRKFSQSNIIFLDAGTNDKEKAEFIKGMKDELNNSKVKFKQVRLGTEMEPNKIIAAMDTLRENIFIPISGQNLALNRLMPQLTLVRREHPNYNMHLFGYPEWQTYTNDHLASSMNWTPISILRFTQTIYFRKPFSSHRLTANGTARICSTHSLNMVCWDSIQDISS